MKLRLHRLYYIPYHTRRSHDKHDDHRVHPSSGVNPRKQHVRRRRLHLTVHDQCTIITQLLRLLDLLAHHPLDDQRRDFQSHVPGHPGEEQCHPVLWSRQRSRICWRRRPGCVEQCGMAQGCPLLRMEPRYMRLVRKGLIVVSTLPSRSIRIQLTALLGCFPLRPSRRPCPTS